RPCRPARSRRSRTIAFAPSGLRVGSSPPGIRPPPPCIRHLLLSPPYDLEASAPCRARPLRLRSGWPVEGSHRGLVRAPAKRLSWFFRDRGFESLPLRHTELPLVLEPLTLRLRCGGG